MLHTARRLPAALAAAVLLAAAPASPDTAAAAVQLGMSPLQHDGSWFDLELEAGEQATFTVELANHGNDPAEAHTYVADVYSLINGGMGVGLYDEPTRTEVTGWIDFDDDDLTLAADRPVERSFTVEVPVDADPGQYLAALVLQGEPDQADDTGGVGINQVSRQAMAINITIPGPAAPDLELGATDHVVTGERSGVRTQLDNTGNRHLSIAANVEITDPDGQQVLDTDQDLAVVYADTSTHVEAILDERLPAGTYTITTTVTEATYGLDAAHTTTFEVEAPERASPIPAAAERISDAIDGQGPLVPILIALVVILLLALTAALIRGSRHAADPADTNVG